MTPQSFPEQTAEATATAPPTLEQRLAQRNRPAGRPAMSHSWRELLFLHWRYDAAVIQQSLPEGLTVDTHDGSAWVGVVPFFMWSIRLRGCPPLPGLSYFQELNLRTYACDETGTPGVWFYSLDANSWPAVKGARALYHLPYFWSRASYRWDRRSGHVLFESRRRNSDLTCRFEYRPIGAQAPAEPGTLEFFLVERYVLFAERGGRLFSGRVHHRPYAIGDAATLQWDAHLIELSPLEAPDRPADHVTLSRGVDVEVFPLRPLGPG